MNELKNGPKGHIIKEYRLKRKLTQKALSIKLGYSSQFLGKVEKDLIATPDKLLIKSIKELRIPKEVIKKMEHARVDAYVKSLYKKKKT